MNNLKSMNPEGPEMDDLVAELARLDGPADDAGVWPDDIWATIERAGASLWAIPAELGGEAPARTTLLRRYARIAEGSMTAAFILTQHDAAVRRLASAVDHMMALRWLELVSASRAFVTVGISQLTTSNRLGPRAVRAEAIGDGRYRVDGVIPWVTAATRANGFVVGASTDDGQQLLMILPEGRTGLTVRPPFRLAALQASCTAEIVCEGVEVETEDILAGPLPDVIVSPGSSGTGGLETSALALGLALAALKALEAEHRDDLIEPVAALRTDWDKLDAALMATAVGLPGCEAPGSIRGQANDLVLRMTQAYLTARKGSGFLLDDPAQRWARQALFFLVWSCPSPVARASIRDLAGLCPT